ncbi:MAG: hypothetical protein JWL81_3526 [Verrucomicrobiales bacterium]|nr:hypothetical protein [Verrucomicrobiales bacterium]
MNQKHLASVLLFAVIIAFSQGVLTLHKKRQAAQEAAEAAEAKLDSASRMKLVAQNALNSTRDSTAPLRKYYRMWLPEFEKTDSEVKAKNSFLQTLKRTPNLVVFDQGMNPLAPNKETTYVGQRATGRARFEGDYQKSIQLLAMFEREHPTSRISSVEIRKGQRANDVEVSLLVEFPVITAPPAAATAAKK